MESNQVEVNPELKVRKASINQDVVKLVEKLHEEKEKKEEIKVVLKDSIYPEIEKEAQRKRSIREGQEETKNKMKNEILPVLHHAEQK